MSAFACIAEMLTVFPHPNADLLELAQVGGFRAVVGKGQYQNGDVAVYIPEGATLPDELIETMGLTGRLAGGKHNRVKAVRLRGELSQGLVYRPSLFPVEQGKDYAEVLGITKYVPEIPASMSGILIGAPNFVPMFEVENIKRYPDMFTPGERVTATEKVHGTNIGVTLDGDGFWVSSKGVGQKLTALEESESNLYWRAVRFHDVEQKLRAIRAGWPGRTAWAPDGRVALFGEVYGLGVQDLDYGIKSRMTPGLTVFDIWVEGHGFVYQNVLVALASEYGFNVPARLYDGPYDYDAIAALADGKTEVGAGAHLREGLVVRPSEERIYTGTWGRAIAKFVSAAYLTRGGEVTEFE